jgi:hypothetical protein
LSVARLATHLYRSMRQVVDSRIIPPLAYEQVAKIDCELGQKLNYINSNRRLKNVKLETGSVKIEAGQVKVKMGETEREGRSQALQRKFNVPNVPPPPFKDIEEEERYKVKQVIVEALLEKGYGMAPFREHVISVGFPIRVEYKKYAGIVTSIATEAFRAIERFLESFCGILVESLPKPDIRILYSILLNFRDYARPLSPTEDYYAHYAIFLRAGYNLAPPGAEVEALSVYRTYQAILKLLMIRAKEVNPIRFDER